MSDKEKLEQFLAAFKHPLRNEIHEVRRIISGANPKLKERIKWNAPSFYYKKDMVAFHVREQKRVHLVFVFYEGGMIKSDLLEGSYKDRRMVYFHSLEDISSKKAELELIVNEWVRLADELQ